MGTIKKLIDNNLVGGFSNTEVYPVTSTKAIYDENNERLDNILNRRLSIKTVVLPQRSSINIDLNNNKVIISEGPLYITTYNTNGTVVLVDSQSIDISDKLNGNSALLFNTKSNSFEFLNHMEQGSVDDNYCIVALLHDRRIYYVSCDIYVNGELFGPINAQNQVKDIQNQVKDILSKENVTSGILWSNLFAGSDMKKGYNQDNILAFSTYPSLGGTVERVLDNETSRYCIKAHFPSGTKFTSGNNYVYPALMKDINFTGEASEQEFSISFRYKCSPNFIGFCPLCNNGFMQYLKKDGSWAELWADTIPLVRDNNWHYAHVITRKTDVSNKTYSVGLRAYFTKGLAVTLEEDLDFCITDIVISPSRFPDYSVVRNVNDYSLADKETLRPTINEIISEYPDAHGCVFMSLGDSISTEDYYMPKLRQLLQPSKYYNLAVAAATWADKAGTTSYDGNPQFNGDQNQNVLGNQLQKIINNPDIYNVAPNIIIISAGTNDEQPVPISTSQQEIIVNIDTHFYADSAAIPITSPTFDDSDTYMSHRKTIAGAMRYVVCKLQEMYPKARIYILTPIQGCYSTRNYGSSIAAKQLYISEVAKHLSVPVIHVGEKCGIQADFEYQGAMWTGPSSSDERSGRDLVDGLHPNTNGSWKMAKYIAKKLLNDYVSQSY